MTGSGIGILVQSGIGVLMQTQSGVNLLIQEASGTTLRQSGLSVIADIDVTVSSGIGVIVQSGIGVTVQSTSGMGVLINSQSGLAVANIPTTYTSVTGGTFAIGTSATQFPSVVARKHVIRIHESGIIYIAGTSAVTSGTGFVFRGDHLSTNVGLELEVNNLNLLYGAAVVSSIIVTHVSFN